MLLLLYSAAILVSVGVEAGKTGPTGPFHSSVYLMEDIKPVEVNKNMKFPFRFSLQSGNLFFA